MDETQAQLEWEARAGRLAAIAAWFGAALLIGALAYRIAALPQGADDVKDFLPDVSANETAFLVSGILTGIGMLAFIPPLLYLYRTTRFRRQELPTIARWLVIVGPVLFCISSIWFQFEQRDAAEQFLASGPRTETRAEDLLRDATGTVAGLSLIASMATGLGTLLVSLNAMRAGLLSRFMGVLGVILGALFVLPLVASPIIQLFWLLALGALFWGVWPGGGRGPAWETGEQVPWPAAHERYIEGQDEDEGEQEAEPEPAAVTHAQRSSRKRKKKSRR